MSQFHSLAWQEFLDDLYLKKEVDNLKVGNNSMASFAAVYLDPNYEEATRLADMYIRDEDYLANSEGLMEFIRVNLIIIPNYQINGLDCIDAILYTLCNTREYFLPPRHLLYNLDTDEPFAYSEIVNDLDLSEEPDVNMPDEDDEKEFNWRYAEQPEDPLEFPSDLNFFSEHSEMLEMWRNDLSIATQKRILSMSPFTEQVRELFRLRTRIKYIKNLTHRITPVNIERNIDRWINKCVREYKKSLLVIDPSHISIRKELHQLKKIMDNFEVNKIKMKGCYIILAQRFIHEVKIVRKWARQKQKDRARMEWEDFYDIFINKTLPTNPRLIKHTIEVLKDHPNERELRKALRNLFKAVNLVPLF